VSLSLAGPPPPDVAVPPAVTALAGGRAVEPVWANQLGGLTFALGDGGSRRFVKWAPAGSGIDLAHEVDRLRWAAPFTPVPRVVDRGTDDDGAWFVTEALAGESAVTDRWKAEPERAAAAIGAGLRALHDALPVERCPFSWSIDDRLDRVDGRARSGAVDPSGWHDDHRPLGLDRALDLAHDPPPIDHLVVCHGDACAPNTLIGPDGTWTGHVDLGALGTADRWADLAVATWSTEWNYGTSFEATLLAAYGIGPDPDRTRYYRLLWDLG
jgi:kanamycin kinase